MPLFLRLLIQTLAVMVTASIVPGIRIASFWSALVAAIVIGIVNALIRPILVLLTLPINVLTLGLFTFVINAVLFWFASSIVKGFDVVNFRAAFFGALLYWLVAWFLNAVAGTKT